MIEYQGLLCGEGLCIVERLHHEVDPKKFILIFYLLKNRKFISYFAILYFFFKKSLV